MPDLKKIIEILKKQKYLLIILAVGVLLMLVPGNKDENGERSVSDGLKFSVEDTEAKIKKTLESCDGVGRVMVTLSVTGGVESVYAEEEKISTRDRDGDFETDSDRRPSLVSEGSGKDSAVVIKELYPEFLGAAIVCDGADNPRVCLNVINTVSSLTGISSERISVAKMKN